MGGSAMSEESQASNSPNMPETIWGELVSYAIILVPWSLGWALYVWAMLLDTNEFYVG